MNTAEMERFLEVCKSLTSERDQEALLSAILDTAIDLACCDAGTLYLLEKEKLAFCRMVTRSLGIRQGGHGDPITLPPVPMEPRYVCSWAALHKKTINVEDIRTDTHFDFTGSIRYDAMTGYNTRSMHVVPMNNERGDLFGVMQLIIAQDAGGNTIPFPAEAEQMVTAIASLSAISITNMQYAEQINLLLDSLIGAMSEAIDERSPYNANHSRNMARYAEAFLDYLESSGHPWAFSRDKRRTFLMSVWLHDVGKLVVPLEVMDKESRLGAALPAVLERLRVIGLLGEISLLRGETGEAEARQLKTELRQAEELIRRVNGAGFLPDELLAQVDALAEKTYLDESGACLPWITEEERTALSVRKGTLTAAERSIMESHVVMTGHILAQVSFPKEYARVPQWAAAHHELLNGSGYPDHRKGESIPPEVRLLTVLDVFDALTARDRPYKQPMPAEKALSILHSMVEEGSVDGDILKLFEESKAWEGKV